MEKGNPSEESEHKRTYWTAGSIAAGLNQESEHVLFIISSWNSHSLCFLERHVSQR